MNRSKLFSKGEMAALMRAYDWSQSSLGEYARWPNALRNMTQVMLQSRYAMWMGWGKDLSFFYNDAYAPTLGKKHPWALGRPAQQVWAEIWNSLAPRIRIVLEEATATYDEGLLLMLERHGFPEETYHTFSYSPLPDDEGGVGGMLCVVVEETERILAERRLTVVRELAARGARARSRQELVDAVGVTLGEETRDVPFALLYLRDDAASAASLATCVGISANHAAAEHAIDWHDGPRWLGEVIAQSALPAVIDLPLRSDCEWPSGAWQRSPTQAIALPIAHQGQTESAGVLIVGVNPHRPLDAPYRDFLDLMAGQIAAGLANAHAQEAERKRVEALAELDMAKTVFFSNVSHEFRTPLTLMLGPLEDALAASDAALPDHRQGLEAVHRNALRLLKLVNSLLDFSRIEAGRMNASFEPTNLAQLTRDLASSFRSAMERAGIEYVVNCCPLPEPVYVDRDMWEKIVLNLLSNAFKYTLQGRVTVSLALAGERHAELVVSDTGVGILKENLPKLFDRFYRVQEQRGRTLEGTGIGLALVNELVKLHGGTIHVQSELGRGSSFTLRIPLGSAHLPAERIQERGKPERETTLRPSPFLIEALRWLPQSDRGTNASPPYEHTTAGTVLVADDNADMREYITRLLSDAYRVVTVNNGRDALERARKFRPDLVLSDVMMPELDGLGLLAALRADPSTRDVPFILLSARAGEEARIEGLAAGADDYLVKPFSARELMVRVATLLEVAKLRREANERTRDEARQLEILNRTGAAVAAELDLDRVVQLVTDAGVALTGAEFGAFFYNVTNAAGESYMLYSLSGVPRERFERFPMPRNTAVFAPTFRGERVVRSDDIRKDPAYGQNPPYHGLPQGHLPVRSYLAVPVTSRSGEVLGGLFFGHSAPGVFTESAERIMIGLSAQAAIAIDNARLYQASRQAEASLRALNETLEQRVTEEIAQRTAAEAAFQQSQKMEALGRLTGGIAHDFNNLLTVIIGSIDNVARKAREKDDDLHRRARMALEAANRATALTHRLLAFARRQPLEPRPTDINRLVSNMSELLRRTIGEHIAIENVHGGGLWWVSVDPNQMESTLLNLAVNARDAMPNGGKLTIETANTFLDEIYAEAHDDVKPGQYTMVAVTDTGMGMPADIRRRAFEPFFTTKEIGKGTGLGLSQVYGFVKQSGGHVKLYSELGSGTTVKIYLPRLCDEEIPAPSRSRTAETYASPAGELILVVEDEEGVRAYSSESLRELGYRVLEARDGVEALRVLAERKDIDLLFTDVGLPGGLTGRQLADEAHRLLPQLKVLYTTGYARNAIVHQGRLDPGVELLVKPFTYAALAAKVADVLGKHRAAEHFRPSIR